MPFAIHERQHQIEKGRRDADRGLGLLGIGQANLRNGVGTEINTSVSVVYASQREKFHGTVVGVNSLSNNALEDPLHRPSRRKDVRAEGRKDIARATFRLSVRPSFRLAAEGTPSPQARTVCYLPEGHAPLTDVIYTCSITPVVDSRRLRVTR